MEQEVQNNQQDAVNNSNYTDPLASGNVVADNGQPAKKKGDTGYAIGSTVAAVALWRLFGILGALICYGGFWAVRAIIKSKMSTALKVLLSVLIVLGCLVLLVLYILVAASLTAA
ncbi:MAG: hypothetical protein K2H41_13220 [Acetatifactor sp.]|nr:hypothetical protein [Acetatifactor sp.]MDE6700300.1 hypothetical protein [Acetatifactor sp.]